MERKTLLAKIIRQYYPDKGNGALLLINVSGVNPEQLVVQRGGIIDSDIKSLKEDYHFVHLVKGNSHFRIDQIIPVDNFNLTAELLSIDGNTRKNRGN